jgi:hypothetical protein
MDVWCLWGSRRAGWNEFSASKLFTAEDTGDHGVEPGRSEGDQVVL